MWAWCVTATDSRQRSARLQASSAKRGRRPCATWQSPRCWSQPRPGAGARAAAPTTGKIFRSPIQARLTACPARSPMRARSPSEQRTTPTPSDPYPFTPSDSIMSQSLICSGAFLSPLVVDETVTRALAEDLGRAGDVTSTATIPEETQARAVVVARAAGVVAGLPLVAAAFRKLAPAIEISAGLRHRDGGIAKPML